MRIITDGLWSPEMVAMYEDICAKLMKMKISFGSETDYIIIDGGIIGWPEYFLQIGGMNGSRYEAVVNRKEEDGTLDRSKYVFGITVQLDTRSFIVFHGTDSQEVGDFTFRHVG